jgi:tetratricopeptide (TPR) repeat protein
MTRARPEDAVAAYSEAIALDPDPETLAAAYANRARALVGLGRFDEGVEDATAAIALDPDPETLAAAYAIRGVSLLKLGGIDEAKADLVRVTSLLPSTHQLYGWADQLLTELNSAN